MTCMMRRASACLRALALAMEALIAGAPRPFLDRRYHAHIPRPLGEDQAHVGPLDVLVLQVVPILVGVQVAGEWVDRLEHAIQRAQADAPHVGLFDVLALDAR